MRIPFYRRGWNFRQVPRIFKLALLLSMGGATLRVQGAVMRLTMRSLLFGMFAAAVCGAQYPGNHAGAPGVHSSGSGVHFASPGFGHVNSLPPPASGITPGAWREIQRSNRFANRQAPYGYFSAPYYPFLGYSDSGFATNQNDAPPPSDPGVQNMMAAQGVLGQQLQILSDQLEQLKNAQQRGAVPQDDPVQETTPQVPITLVLRNGQQIQVQNYAVMDQTFWDFTRQPARRIPVSSIDIAASTRATEAKGAEFPQIGTP
jgi:hypothetical protein